MPDYPKKYTKSPLNVSVIGLGKLGASMAACMAAKGIHVVGVDINPRVVEAVNAAKAPVQETGLDELIFTNRERLWATMSHEEAVLNSDISFAIVPTPSDSRGAFTLQYAKFAFTALGRALKTKNSYHVVVLTSTVLPGSMRQGLLPILEKESGKRCGEDFGLCYNPEFIALGSVIRDFLNPDFYLVGEYDIQSGDVLESVHQRISENRAPIKRMSLENAEMVKISINSFITMKISFANMLAELAENVPGGDVDILSDAIGMDSRIGRKYLTGGLGFGGPCFPRDNLALSFLGRHLGVECGLLETNDTFNRNLSARLVEKLRPRLPAGATIAVLGLAYKPFSHVVEESPGVDLCKKFSAAGYRVIGFDPLAGESADTALKYHTLVAHSLEECLRDAQVVLVTTRDPLFTALNARDLLGTKQQIIVVDFWRCLSPELADHPNIDYIPIGRCLEPGDATQVLNDLWNTTEN